MLNATASRAAKDRGIQQSIFFEGEWVVAVLAELRAWLEARRAAGRTTMTFEQFRHDALAQPSSHKAWGSLPALACREGLIAPMTHSDGSPVMRRAESVKTHSHPVRLWAVAPLFPAEPADEETPTLIETEGSQARRQPTGIDGRGVVLHGGNAGSLLQATSDYHRQRAGMEGC